MINAENVTFAYPPLMPDTAPERVLQGCSLRLEDGGALAVMGRSGAGKSTLGYVLAGLAPRHTGGTVSGTVNVDGQDVLVAPPKVGTIGLLFQDAPTQLFNPSVEDEIAWGLEALGLPPHEITMRVDEALARFDLDQVRFRAPWALSGGQQKRLALASLWTMQPRTLYLDEPFGGLDPWGKAEVADAIAALQEAGTSLLITTLQPDTARLVGHASLLQDGRLSSPFPTQAGLEAVEQGSRPRPSFGSHASELISAGVVYPASLWPDLGPVGTIEHGQPAVIVRDLSFGYSRSGDVLHSVELTIASGQFVALMGPNGAGKSTLVRHFNGLLRPRQGVVEIMGEAVASRATGSLAQDVGYLFQRPEQQLFAASVREEIAFGPRRLGVADVPERVEKVLAQFGLSAFAESPPATLSYGLQRAVTLASLAALNPPIVILDEPTVGLDGWGLAQLLTWLSQLRMASATIVLVTHNVNLARCADRAITLDAGRIVADGAPSDVLTDLQFRLGDL